MKFFGNLIYMLIMPPIILFIVGGFFSLIGLPALGVLFSIIAIGINYAIIAGYGSESPIDEETQRSLWEKERNKVKR